MEEKTPHISGRIRAVRLMRYGERGRSAFARDLGIPVNSLLHYETDRSPPAEILVKISEVAGINIEWLLAGRGTMEKAPREHSQQTKVLLDRMALILDRRPDLISVATNLVELLEQPGDAPVHPLPTPVACHTSDDLIPVVGSTAAGPAHYWKELIHATDGPIADKLLETRIENYLSQQVHQRAVTDSEFLEPSPARSAALVQFSSPQNDGFLEFVSAPAFKQNYPRAIAWRIDGDSMSPRYLDRDLVITSPDHPAVPQYPCVSRQQGQIGVNCKLYVVDGDDVLLIPINDRNTPQRVPRSQVQWAWRVLASVRFQ